jgi:hypothetical protein
MRFADLKGSNNNYKTDLNLRIFVTEPTKKTLLRTVPLL